MRLREIPCWIAVLGLAGPSAAGGLPPLRVDPALLGGPLPAAPKPPPVAPAPKPMSAPPREIDPPAAMRSTPAPASAALLPVAPLPAPVPAVQAPLALVPVARQPETPAPAVSAPAVRTREMPATAVQAPAEPIQIAPVAQIPAVEAPAVQAPLVQPSEPPIVMERQAPAPTYSAHVAAGELPAPKPRPSAADAEAPQPLLVTADRLHGRNDVEIVAEGKAELRKVGTTLNADRLSYNHLDDEVDAVGNVRLQRDADRFSGPHLRMRVEENVGFFEQPTYAMTKKVARAPETGAGAAAVPQQSKPLVARGRADRVEFEGEGLYRFTNATYSTCSADNDDWHAEVGDLRLDYNRDTAEGSEGKVVFKGTPILYSPWLSFSLDNQRKSGFLTPTIGSTSTSGAEAMVPWYWNIAPNMDATIAPRFMTKRGTQVNADVRYLDYNYSGETHLEYLPNDRLMHKDRVGYSIQHRQQLPAYGLSGSLNLNGVSDNTYFSDLSKPAANLSQGNLLRQGQLAYAGGWWNASLTAQRYQILQDPSLPPAVEPYRRVPQFNLVANRYDLPWGSTFGFNGEFVRFGHPTDVVGQRTTLYPQFSLPLQTSFLQVTPKIGYHLTSYALNRQAAGTPGSQTRDLPIFSVDSSLVFERDTDWFGRGMTQTLEPRLYYLYVPNRDQTKVPVFDTGVADFNLAQIFAENRYGGGDRIADANQLTAAVTSRLVDPATGAELVRGLIGQRYYFSTQHVTLPAVGTNPAEVARTGRSADVLAAVSGQVMPKTYVDTGWQYNPRDARTERLNLGGRYQPEIGKVLNAGYRYTRDLLGQIDVSGQWPLGGGWHGVGRYNYSTMERRMIESVAGVEYDGGCWVARVVVQRIATQTQLATTSLFLQLELNGFSRLGTNPLDVLKRNVPGYGTLNHSAADPLASPY